MNRIEWDSDEILDSVRQEVVEDLRDQDAVLIVNGTRFLKKGVRSAEVQLTPRIYWDLLAARSLRTALTVDQHRSAVSKSALCLARFSARG
ncbi:hypothetical protein GCM10010306_098690 [Streptomyces umbrinus]|nr:hypothetical protein GCM10010306_098690 [Streptomyces umbrinus]